MCDARKIRARSYFTSNRWSDQDNTLKSIRNIALEGVNKALEGQFWHQKWPSKRVEQQGHKERRAQTGITSRAITSGIPRLNGLRPS